MTKQDINRHLARAEALGNDLQAVVGTSLDKGVELDALKALPALLAVAYPVKYCSGMIALGRIDIRPLGSRSKILREVIG